MIRWDPDSYLRLEHERTMPSRDLVARVDVVNPGRIVDIGRGPGVRTRVLSNAWTEKVRSPFTRAFFAACQGQSGTL